MKANPIHLMRAFISTAALLAVVSLSQAAGETVIFYDSFTPSGSGTYLDSHAPDVSLIGAKPWKYTREGAASYTPQIISPNEYVSTFYNGGGYIDIRSTETYTKPSTFTISATLTLNTIVGSVGTAGIGLGFYASPPAIGTSANTSFTGLLIHATGQLRFISNGNFVTGSFVQISDFSASTAYSLSYTINVDGKIDSVVLSSAAGSTDYSSNFSGLSVGATDYACFFARSNTSTTANGMVDNFRLTTTESIVVPEPAAAAFVVAILGACVVFLRCATRHSAAVSLQ